MTQRINITLDFDQDVSLYLRQEYPEVKDWRIVSKSLDARNANKGRKPKVALGIELVKEGEHFTPFDGATPDLGPFKSKPIIIGSGPAGLFCALRLADHGVPSIILERGGPSHERMASISRFWRHGEFDLENNVCFGEGGAGLYSDGKLITRIKSPYVSYVMKRLVDFGAPLETAYLSNPHLGSNGIRKMISAISSFLKSKGSELRYHSKVENLILNNGKVEGVQLSNGEKIYSSHIIMAVGHSAKEIYFELKNLGVAMKAKDFAIGVRIEHPRSAIDHMQFGRFAGNELLGAARYRLSFEDPKTKLGTYTFCMCPGGYVLSSGTDANGIVVNGMSNIGCNSPWTNSALVVSVKAGEHFQDKLDVLSGHHFQKNIEKKAYQQSQEHSNGRALPSIRVSDFLDGKKPSKKLPRSSSPSGVFAIEFDEILPSFIGQSLRRGLLDFDRKMKGFIHPDAILLAPETRTSAPVSILRDEIKLESISHKGLYPCGEGAGYAGGITSAAVDGVKVAMSLLAQEKSYVP